MKLAVVGHVEWVEFLRVERVPVAGEITTVLESWEEPAGGGAVAAVQLAKLAPGAVLYTALGDDPLGRRARDGLAGMGVRVEAVFRPGPQRRAVVFVDAAGERTITVVGEKHAPCGDDPLPWSELAAMDGVFFVAGDPAAARAARAARVMTATSRELATLRVAAVALDALIGSGRDPAEAYSPGDLDPAPDLAVATAGPAGGSFVHTDGDGSYPALPLRGPIGDTYGCGDSFAAGLAYALAAGLTRDDAIALAARCGAACLGGRGAYEGQLSAADVMRQ